MYNVSQSLPVLLYVQLLNTDFPILFMRELFKLNELNQTRYIY